MISGPRLAYDEANMREKGRGEAGESEGLKKAHESLEALRAKGSQGFFDLPFDEKTAKGLERMAKKIRGRGIKKMILIGIGGSNLGAKTILSALDEGKGVETTFLDNPDPESVFPLLSPSFDWKKTLLVVISKSGRTLETTAIFDVLWKTAKKSLGDAANENIFVVTDPISDNPLLARAEKESFHVLPHPLTVGGRFSVLSVVGLFPAALAGIDIRGLLKGAREMEEAWRKEGVKHIAAQFASLQYLAITRGKKQIHVLMPYQNRLKEFAFWFRQLWAESLGKEGKGSTPIASLGTVDQHSQIQLYNDGPNDKVVTFIGVEKYAKRVKTPSGLDFAEILTRSMQGAAHGLAEHGRLNGTLQLPSLTPETLGGLFQFFLLATAYLGEMLEVNAYDQPGVEAGKKETARLLGLVS